MAAPRWTGHPAEFQQPVGLCRPLPHRLRIQRSALYMVRRNRHRWSMDDSIGQLIAFLVIGAAAGWLAGILIKGGGFGLLGNMAVGVLGAVVGGWLAGVLGITVGGEWVGRLVTATAGAVVLLFLMRFVRK